MRGVDAGALLVELASEMRRRANASRCEIELAEIGLAVSGELRDGLHRQLRRDDDHLRRGADDRDGGKLLEQIVGHARLQRRIDHDLFKQLATVSIVSSSPEV